MDRGALEAALALRFPCGGWCPRGRRAEDGRIPDRYPVRESTSAHYPARTAQNVREADGTLVLTRGPADRGTALTLRLAGQHGRPMLHLDLQDRPAPAAVLEWLAAHGIRVLNVAGPRESRAPGIQEEAELFLRDVLGRLRCGV